MKLPENYLPTIMSLLNYQPILSATDSLGYPVGEWFFGKVTSPHMAIIISIVIKQCIRSQLQLWHLATRLVQKLEYQPNIASSALIPIKCFATLVILLCIIVVILLLLHGDQPQLYRCTLWHPFLGCDAYRHKSKIRIAAPLISSADAVNLSVTRYLGQYHSLWPGSTLVVLIAWGEKLYVPRTCILAINCSVCVSG